MTPPIPCSGRGGVPQRWVALTGPWGRPQPVPDLGKAQLPHRELQRGQGCGPKIFTLQPALPVPFFSLFAARLTHTAKTAKCTWGDVRWYSNILISFSFFLSQLPSLSPLPAYTSGPRSLLGNGPSCDWFPAVKELLTPTLSEGYSSSSYIFSAMCIQIRPRIVYLLSRFATLINTHTVRRVSFFFFWLQQSFELEVFFVKPEGGGPECHIMCPPFLFLLEFEFVVGICI